ncbi:antitoxin family protein [Argonema antarcticum]|uniref:antitoxin family protein n=1 Tax=Argonema antarcticum TaxID=2942763 RepID=UPI002012A134|nr:antitoxin family protein [Argonema antarcticum]MCL1470500.1 antitoxin family protein [Argonema antarcticum A004/B2]
MTQTLDAIYEKGVFRPLTNPEIAEGESVKLIVETASKINPEEMLKLAAQVYEGLSEEQINEIEQIALARSNFFTENNP